MGSGVNYRSFDKWWIIFPFLLTFLLNYVLQYFGISTNFSRNYLDDFLAMPIILWIARTALRLIHKKSQIELDFTMIVSAFLTVSLVFELILPEKLESTTGDFFDVLCYGCGVIIYQLAFQNDLLSSD